MAALANVTWPSAITPEFLLWIAAGIAGAAGLGLVVSSIRELRMHVPCPWRRPGDSDPPEEGQHAWIIILDRGCRVIHEANYIGPGQGGPAWESMAHGLFTPNLVLGWRPHDELLVPRG